MTDILLPKPLIGITIGDYNGIGPEVILKALADNKMLRMCTPIIYGSMKVLIKYRKLLNLEEWVLNAIKSPDQANPRRTNLIACWDDQNLEIEPGKSTPDAGQGAYLALKAAAEDLKNGLIEAVVTAPINKHNIQSEHFQYAGHTEFFAEHFAVRDDKAERRPDESLMFLVSPRIRVGVVTGHLPLEKVKASLTGEKITAKIHAMAKSLQHDFGIQKPKIAVLGLNPHAGEEGLLGSEEQEIILPAVQALKNKGMLLYGPFPADGFFGTGGYRKFDAVLAMYHDQGLIPFKLLAFEDGVNFTAGLTVVRTSPDHGTAYSIAGKNLADETSMREAIFTACDIVKRRKELVSAR
ncbi:MAG: 4-hydroxythreonine-4-phosphate dehydrogenase PdxA [Ferruginibacter sp.]|nr:4-hydroxythreonine-4-phosphate dehydrogenase PdxA [Cytophagales bacterium]